MLTWSFFFKRLSLKITRVFRSHKLWSYEPWIKNSISCHNSHKTNITLLFINVLHKCLMSKTRTLFNSNLPSNDVKLSLNFFPSQIISLWMKDTGNLKSLYLKWHWSFSLEFSETELLGLAPLYHKQIKSPKTIYLTEQCQLMSHRNSVHSVRRGTKCQKRHVLTTFLSFCWLNAIQMHKCKFLCPKCTFKGKLLIRKCWFRPFIRFRKCHFLAPW